MFLVSIYIRIMFYETPPPARGDSHALGLTWMSLPFLPVCSGAGSIFPVPEIPPRRSLGPVTDGIVGPWLGVTMISPDALTCAPAPALARSVLMENPPPLELLFFSALSAGADRCLFQEQANKLSGLR